MWFLVVLLDSSQDLYIVINIYLTIKVMIKKTHSPTKKLTIVFGLIFSAIQPWKCTRQYKNKNAHTITPIVFTKAHNIVDMAFNFNSFTNFVLSFAATLLCVALYNVAACFVCYNL